MLNFGCKILAFELMSLDTPISHDKTESYIIFITFKFCITFIQILKYLLFKIKKNKSAFGLFHSMFYIIFHRALLSALIFLNLVM